MMNNEGYLKFSMHHHTELWKSTDSKNPEKHFGVPIANTWYWYESWVEFVRNHCKENEEKYK